MTQYSNPRKDGPQTDHIPFNSKLEHFYNMYSKIDDGSLGKFKKTEIPYSFLGEIESCLAIDFETFSKAIEAIHKNDSDADTLYDMGIAITYSTAFAMNEIVLTLLEKIMSDESHWIEYFCYELDFGSKWESGMITYNDKDLPLSTIRELWDLLIWEIALSLKLKFENSEEEI